MKVAVITPYYGEGIETLKQCHASVLAQTHAADHFLVSDGRCCPAIDGWNAQHIILPKSHRDAGDTPRGMGALSALSQGFDAIAFLDADNRYDESHIASCVETCAKREVPVVFASRRIVLSTGEICPFDDLEAEQRRHVDTSCFFICKEAAFLLPLWSLIPSNLWEIGDRILLAAIRARAVPHEWTTRRTVYYQSRWGMHFRAMGLAPPADEHFINWKRLRETFDADILRNRFGFDPGFDTDIFSNRFRANPSDPVDYLTKLHFYDLAAAPHANVA